MRKDDVAQPAAPESDPLDVPTTPDVALGTAAALVAQGLAAAAHALLNGSATDEQRDAARVLVLAARGVPATAGAGPTMSEDALVVCLNIAGWIEQARGLQTVVKVHDANGQIESATPRDLTLKEKADWLRRHALTLDQRFEKLSDTAWISALTPPPKPGAVGALSESATLVAAAGLHTNAVGLARSASNLRSRSKPGP